MPHDVLISHSSKDKPWADAVCATLEANDIRCWIAPRDIPPGVEYPAALAAALKASRIVLLVYSAESNQSPQVQKEVERTVALRIPVLPFRIEEVPLSQSMEYLISTPQWFDAMSPEREKTLAMLVPTVQRLLSAATTTPLDRVVVPKLPKLLRAQRTLRRLQLGVAGAAAILLAAGGTRYYLTRTEDLAVLPYQVEAGADGDSALGTLAVQLPEEILEGLAQRSGLGERLHLHPWPPLKAWAGKSPEEAAAILGVKKVVNGRITRHGDSLTVETYYLDVPSHRLINSEKTEESFEHPCSRTANPSSGDSSGLLDLRSAVVNEILSGLAIWVSPAQKRRALEPPTDNCEAFQLYLSARAQWDRRDSTGFHEAARLFRAAIARDPKFALAYSGIADCLSLLADYSFVAPSDSLWGFPAARDNARRALEIAPDLPEAHTSLAFVHYQYDWDWAGAQREFDVVPAASQYATATQWHAIYLAAMGRGSESIKRMTQAVQQDPGRAILRTNLGWLWHLARQDDSALNVLRSTRLAHPTFEEAARQLGDVYIALKDYRAALAQYTAAEQLGRNIEYESLIARAQAFLGNRSDALREIDSLKARMRRQYTPASYVALIYIALGDHDSAFQWLDQAIKDRSDEMILLKVDPAYDPLRGDPRFGQLLKRVGLPG